MVVFYLEDKGIGREEGGNEIYQWILFGFFFKIISSEKVQWSLSIYHTLKEVHNQHFFS
jgi:hypothetical protein